MFKSSFPYTFSHLVILLFVEVSEGEELTCYYHYLLSDCPTWYAELWEAQGSS
jgi:hypothetical protein